MTYYKATRLDGTDFCTGTVDYGAALISGEIVRHPRSSVPIRDDASTYLSISIEPTGTMVGGSWPCRLFEVAPARDVLSGLRAHRHKRATSAMHVVREVEPWKVFGPDGRGVVAIIDRISQLSDVEVDTLCAAWDSAWGAARDAAWSAARNASWDAALLAAWDAAWGAVRVAAWRAAWNAVRDDDAWYIVCDAARNAASAYLVKDLISDEHFNALHGPWASVIDDM